MDNPENVNRKKHFCRNLFISLIILLIGLGMCVLCVNEILIHKYKVDTYKETIGTIYDHDISENLYRAIIIQYKVDDEIYEIKSKKYSRNVQSIGDIVSIHYNEKDPSDAVITYESIDWKYMAISIFITLIGLIIFIKVLRKRFGKKKEIIKEIDEEAKKYEELAEKVKTKNISFDNQTLGTLRNSKDED